jgi:hypothetical protein
VLSQAASLAAYSSGMVTPPLGISISIATGAILKSLITTESLGGKFFFELEPLGVNPAESEHDIGRIITGLAVVRTVEQGTVVQGQDIRAFNELEQSVYIVHVDEFDEKLVFSLRLRSS